MKKPIRFSLLLTIAVTLVDGFFAGVAMQASGLFHLVTHERSDWWDWSFQPVVDLRFHALNNFMIAASVIAVSAIVLHYVVRPTCPHKIVSTLVCAALFGWFVLLNPNF